MVQRSIKDAGWKDAARVLVAGSITSSGPGAKMGFWANGCPPAYSRPHPVGKEPRKRSAIGRMLGRYSSMPLQRSFQPHGYWSHLISVARVPGLSKAPPELDGFDFESYLMNQLLMSLVDLIGINLVASRRKCCMLRCVKMMSFTIP
jgi:hypothetical protein